MTESVIRVENLSIEYRFGRTWLNAVDNVDLRIDPLQIHGLVGESGSGKSTVAMAMATVDLPLPLSPTSP